MTKLVKIEVPFEGFYQTFLGAAVEAEIDNHYSVGSVEVDRNSIAKDWLELYSQQISKALAIDAVMLSFAELISPRDYNFQNDRIVANIMEDELAILRDAMQKLYPPEYLQNKASALFLNRDCFISFNSELDKHENWGTLENRFIGLLWLPSANDFAEVMGYDLNQYIAEELYSRGSINNNVHFPDSTGEF